MLRICRLSNSSWAIMWLVIGALITIYLTIDLVRAYHQIAVRDQDIEKTSVISYYTLYIV